MNIMSMCIPRICVNNKYIYIYKSPTKKPGQGLLTPLMHRGEASSCSFLCSTTHQKNALSGFFRAYFLALGGTLTLPQKSNNACHFSPFQRTHAPRLPAPASPSTTINHHHHRRHHRRRHHHHQQHTTKATATI